ncbi:MAG: zinc-dependent peptidase [Haliangiales bacterium]
MIGPFRWLRRRRLKRRPFPPEWHRHLDANVPFAAALTGAERDRFLCDLKVFAWEKHFIAAAGMEITDEVIVTISAAAVRLTVHLGMSRYDRLRELIVYPSHYHHPDRPDGVILGEAHQWGTVVLSWDAVKSGLKNPRDGHDTATHEFAHVLDRAGGDFNGTPALRAHEHYRPWAQVMSRHFLALRNRGRRHRRILRAYGATNEAEFFAVATETFFEKPAALAKRLPDLYDELRRFYGFDPANRG